MSGSALHTQLWTYTQNDYAFSRGPASPGPVGVQSLPRILRAPLHCRDGCHQQNEAVRPFSLLFWVLKLIGRYWRVARLCRIQKTKAPIADKPTPVLLSSTNKPNQLKPWCFIFLLRQQNQGRGTGAYLEADQAWNPQDLRQAERRPPYQRVRLILNHRGSMTIFLSCFLCSLPNMFILHIWN